MIRRPSASWVGGLVRLSDAVSFLKSRRVPTSGISTGVINALFSGVAFSATIAAIYLKRQELLCIVARADQHPSGRQGRAGPQHESALAIIRCRSHNTVFHQQAQNFSAGRRLTGRIPMAEPIGDLIMQIRTVGRPFE
jgi:hypothetical protein